MLEAKIKVNAAASTHQGGIFANPNATVGFIPEGHPALAEGREPVRADAYFQ